MRPSALNNLARTLCELCAARFSGSVALEAGPCLHLQRGVAVIASFGGAPVVRHRLYQELLGLLEQPHVPLTLLGAPPRHGYALTPPLHPLTIVQHYLARLTPDELARDRQRLSQMTLAVERPLPEWL